MTSLNFAQGWYTSGTLSSLFLLCTLVTIDNLHTHQNVTNNMQDSNLRLYFYERFRISIDLLQIIPYPDSTMQQRNQK